MLSRFAQLYRLGGFGLMCAIVVPTVIAAPSLSPLSSSVAFADDDDDDDDDDFDDDDDGGGDDDDDDEEPQPPVTAGGMFTKKTYPLNAIERTLMVIGGMAEIRAGIDIDVGDQTAFEVWRFRFDGRYGLKDNVELQADGNILLAGDRVPGTLIGQFGVAIEGGLYFEAVDVRAGVAIPVFQGNTAEDTAFGFDFILGVPFRYRYQDKVAILALDKILTIHTVETIVGQGKKPDLTIGVAAVVQLVPKVAAIGRAEVTVQRFNTKAIVIPATAAIQFTPNNKFDIGAEFSFLNLKPAKIEGVEDDQQPKFYDQRSLLLFGQARF